MLKPPAAPDIALPRQPTPAELEEAARALAQLWPLVLLTVMHGFGSVEGYVKDGRLEKTDVSLVTRRDVARR